MKMYPEIAEGGIESPAGADYPGPPLEVPALRSQMKGKLNMMVGLANDELGYIIPKSQWDTELPYAYGRTKSPQYGEENSPGPDVGSRHSPRSSDSAEPVPCRALSEPVTKTLERGAANTMVWFRTPLSPAPAAPRRWHFSSGLA
ncbi:MAG: hypothetical protein V9H26_25245 [Verrucomicrobiota bacterium]